MKNFKVFVLSVLILPLFIHSAFANESTGYLKDIYVSQQGLVLFRLDNPVNQRPKCANNVDWDYKLDLNQPHSDAMFEMLRMAQLTSKPVRVGYGAEPDCGKGFPAVNIHYVLFLNLLKKDHANKGNYNTKSKK